MELEACTLGVNYFPAPSTSDFIAALILCVEWFALFRVLGTMALFGEGRKAHAQLRPLAQATEKERPGPGPPSRSSFAHFLFFPVLQNEKWDEGNDII